MMNQVPMGSDAVAQMNAIEGHSDDAIDELWGLAIDGNLAQLHEEFAFDNDEEIAAGIHKCADEFGLDEYASTNGDIYNMVNSAMRILLMIQNAQYID